MQYFYINKGSVNPTLRIELVKDGRHDYLKSYQFNNAIQDSVVTFSMRNIDTDKPKIHKAAASIVLCDEGTCDERYILEYEWQKRDVSDVGSFKGQFEITFNGDLVENGVRYPKGNLIEPIREDIIIMIK